MRIEIERFLKSIWPTVYKIVNGAFYFILNLIKSTISLMLASLRGEE